jgi:putative hydrolase of the HAD superfamily
VSGAGRALAGVGEEPGTDVRPQATVRAVLLDIDDTLVDTRYAFHQALAGTVRTWLPHLDQDGQRTAVRRWIDDPHGHFGRYTRGEVDFFTQRRLRATQLLAEFGGPFLDDRLWERWQEVYESSFRAAWRLTPDAVPLLDRLAARELRLGVVTNSETGYQQDKLAAVGLAGRFATVIGVDVLGRGKPAPEVFRLACDRLGVAVSQTAYVGDELDGDARGARDAGLIGIWLDRHGTGRTPADVPVARTLDDVPGLLGFAEAGAAPFTG